MRWRIKIMKKMVWCLIGVCCISNFVLTHPSCHLEVMRKEVMIGCAVKYSNEHPGRQITIQHLTADKPNLVRAASQVIVDSDLSLYTDERAFLDCFSLVPLAPQNCPIQNSPPKKIERKRKSMVALYIDEAEDCVVKQSPPPSPKTKKNSDLEEVDLNKINRLHRQWKSVWKSDDALQVMLQMSLNEK